MRELMSRMFQFGYDTEGGDIDDTPQKIRLNIPADFGRIRALLKSVGVEPWHVSVK